MKNTFVCECVCVLCQMKTKRNKMLWCLNHSDAKALWIVWVGGTVFDDEKCARWHAFLQTCFSTTNIFVFGCLPVSSQFLFFFWFDSVHQFLVRLVFLDKYNFAIYNMHFIEYRWTSQSTYLTYFVTFRRVHFVFIKTLYRTTIHKNPKGDLFFKRSLYFYGFELKHSVVCL